MSITHIDNVINPHILDGKRNLGHTMPEKTVRKAAAARARETVQPENPRRLPVQERSRARVEHVLAVATELIAAHGSDALRMSEIADRSKISIGSLYQYFPDKSAVIRRLAERFNAEGQDCVAAELDKIRNRSGLIPALMRVTDSYYAMFLAEPVMRDIWSGTQADKALVELDAADGRAHGRMLAQTLLRLEPAADSSNLEAEAFLVMHLIAATVRLAITLSRADGDKLIATFKQTILSRLQFGAWLPRRASANEKTRSSGKGRSGQH
jgi:AcrR family transcriptional regulator